MVLFTVLCSPEEQYFFQSFRAFLFVKAVVHFNAVTWVISPMLPRNFVSLAST